MTAARLDQYGPVSIPGHSREAVGYARGGKYRISMTAREHAHRATALSAVRSRIKQAAYMAEAKANKFRS